MTRGACGWVDRDREGEEAPLGPARPSRIHGFRHRAEGDARGDGLGWQAGWTGPPLPPEDSPSQWAILPFFARNWGGHP